MAQLQSKTAVVILNWNGVEMMRKFLPSVMQYSADEAAVYVADNGSTDDSLKMLRTEFPAVKIIAFSENHGFAEGYNKALQTLSEDYFVLLNSDVEVTPHWLTPMIDFMERHQEAAACQPKLLAQKRKDFFEYAGAAGGYMDKYGYPFCRGRVFNHVERDNGQYNQKASLFWATGAALMVRREDWIAAGGLDARFFAHMEEIDFCWRLKSRKRQIYCIPESAVYHVGGGTLDALNPRKTFLNFRNNLLMLYKNLTEEELPVVMRRRQILDCIAMLQFLATGKWKHAKAVFRARREFRKLKPDFKKDRLENLAAMKEKYPPEKINRSLLFLYYLKGKKTYDALKSYINQ